MPPQGHRITKAVAYTQEINGAPAVFVDGFIWEGFGLYLARYVYDTWKAYGKPVLVVVSSDGGILAEGLAFYDFVRAKGVEGTIEIYGKAGSTATVFAEAFGKANCSISENSEWFMHHAYVMRWDELTYQYVRVTDLSAEQQADLDRVNATLVNIYVTNSGLSAEEVEALLTAGDAGATLSASEAVEKGFCEKVIEPIASNIAAFKRIAPADNTETMENDKSKGKVPVKLSFGKAVAAAFGGEVTAEVDVDKAVADQLAAKDEEIEALKGQVKTLEDAAAKPAEEEEKPSADAAQDPAQAKEETMTMAAHEKIIADLKKAHEAEMKKPLAERTVADNRDPAVAATPGSGKPNEGAQFAGQVFAQMTDLERIAHNRRIAAAKETRK